MRPRNVFATSALVIVILLSVGRLTNASSDITRTISFSTAYGDMIFTDTFTIPADSLSYYRSQPHPPAVQQDSNGEYQVDFSTYITPDMVSHIATSVASVAKLGEEDVADTVLSFVQNLGFDLKDHKYGNTLYPMETLASGGVCGDLSVVYASMMVALGFKVILIWYPKALDSSGTTHLNVGVHLSSPPGHTTYGNYTDFTENGEKYYTAETTATGWRVGDEPSDFHNTHDYLYEVSVPASLSTLTMTTTQNQFLTKRITLTSTSTQTLIASPSSSSLFLIAIVAAAIGYFIGRQRQQQRNDDTSLSNEANISEPSQSTWSTPIICRFCGREIRHGRFCPNCHLSTD